MRAFAHDVFTYPLPAGHRFALGKYRLVRQGAEKCAAIEVEDPRPAADDELSLAHGAAYLARVAGGTLARREVLALRERQFREAIGRSGLLVRLGASPVVRVATTAYSSAKT